MSHDPHQEVRRERRGATRATLVLLGLAGVAVAGLLWWLSALGGTPETGTVRVAAAPSRSGTTTLAPSEVEGRDLAPELPWRTHSIAAQPNVRLGGDGLLTGRVLDRATGAGVPDLRVDLLPNTPAATDLLSTVLRMARTAGGMEERSLAVAVARTGRDGRFAFQGVREGTYFLDARGEGHVPDEIRRVRVLASGTGGPVDLYVCAGGRVVGRVLRPDGAPAAGALVSLVHGPRVALTALRDGETRRLDGQCDAEGAFEIAGVSPGPGYQLHTMGRGFALSHADVPEVVGGADVRVVLQARAGVTVRGRVLSVDDASDETEVVPLPGAQVAALPQGLRNMAYNEEVLDATSVTTDAEGRYTMRHVPPGEIEVLAIAPGHVSGTSPRLVLPAAGSANAPDLVLRGGPVLAGRVVDSGGLPIPGVHVRWFTGEVAPHQSFDFSFAPLMHQAVGEFEFPSTDAEGRFRAGPFAGGTPYPVYFAKAGYPYTRVLWMPERDGPEVEVVLVGGGVVTGRVVDRESGAPVPSFTVLGDRIDGDYRQPSVYNPFSGGQLVESASGRFRVDDVQTPAATLTFVAPGYHPADLDVDVAEGAESAGHVVELVPGGRIAGRVTNGAGDPVPGTQVAVLAGGEWSLVRTLAKARGHQRNGAYDDTPSETFTNSVLSMANGLGFLAGDAATSDAEGRYVLDGVAPGTYAVVARRRGFALGKSAPFALGEGERIADLDVVLPRGAKLHGRVTDRFDRPIPDAILLAVSPNEFSGDQSAGAAAYQGACDAGGYYAIEHMAGGSYLLSVVREDATLNLMTLAGTFQFDLVHVPPEQDVRHDVVDLSSATCRVTGQVTSAGEPVTTGGLLAVRFDADNALGLDVKAARVGADSTFSFPGLAPGAYQFVYQSGGAELRVEVDVPDEPELWLELALPWAGARGRVVAAEDGRPVARAWVELVPAAQPELDPFVAMTLYGRAGNERVRTDGDGVFSFLGYAAGSYRVLVQPPRGEDLGSPAPVEVELREDEVTGGLRIELPPALALAGFVEGPEGPLHRARVVAIAVDGRPTKGRDLTDDAGRFRIEGLGPGTYELLATAEGHAEGRSEAIEVRAGSTEEPRIRLTPGVELSLSVVSSAGEPLAGARASVFDERGRPLTRGAPDKGNVFSFFTQDAGSDADGRLALGRYAPGTYRVQVWRGAMTARIEDVVLETGPPVELAAELR